MHCVVCVDFHKKINKKKKDFFSSRKFPCKGKQKKENNDFYEIRDKNEGEKLS